MTEPVRFWWRGGMVSVDDVPADTTVLDWLRGRGATGTKEGCGEGDCGACTVAVGDPSGTGSAARLELHPADACLLLLPMLHGRALFTVEDVAPAGRLHPVQEALVANRGTQCGFCTPGFVMSLWCAYETAEVLRPSRADLADRLTGNLCRCTGYRSILDAAEVAFSGTRAATDVPHAQACAALADVEGPLDYHACGTRFAAPTTVTDLLAELAGRPDALLLGGGTDLVLAARLERRQLPGLVWTGRVRELRTVARDADAGTLTIGGGVTLERAWEALAAENAALVPWWRRFAGPAIRAVGTLAGNLVNGSPIADGTPVLLALDADLLLASATGRRRVPLDGFHLGRRQTALGAGEIVVGIEVPLAALGMDLRAFKASRRHDCDISAVGAVLGLRLDAGSVADVRVVLNGMAATVRRARSVEAAMTGRRWDRDTLAAAQAALADDVSPMSDHRGSAGFRLRTAQGLLERWWWQTRPDAPLPADRTEVGAPA